MRIATLVLVATLLIAVAPAQYLETTIRVPQPTNAIEWDPVGNRVFCAVGCPEASGAVAVLDGATNVCIATVPVPDQMPGGLLIEPGSGKVFCAGSSYSPLETSLVTVFSGANGRIIANLPVGPGPKAMCYNPGARKLYCASQVDNTVSVVDCARNEVAATVAVENWPYELLYVAENNSVYCACRGDYATAGFKILIIDGATDSVVSQIMVGYFPVALCHNPADRKLYCANNFDGTVSIISTITNTIVATDTVVGGPTSLLWDPASDRVYVGADGAQVVSVIDGVTNRCLPPISQPGPVSAICRDSATGKIYCANYLNDAVTVLDGKSGHNLAVISLGLAPWTICSNPLNGRVYAASQDSGVIAVIRDSAANAADEPAAVGSTRPALRSWPNPCASVLNIEANPAAGGSLRAGLFDARGSLVTHLGSGANDISRISVGVYFLRSNREQSSAKVVVKR